MYKLLLAGAAGLTFALSAHAAPGQATASMVVSGDLVIGCEVAPVGAVDFGDQVANPNATAPEVALNLEVTCRTPFQVRWEEGGDNGYVDISTLSGTTPSAGYLFLADDQGNPITATSGYAGDNPNNAVTVPLVVKVANDTAGTQQLSEVVALSTSITLKIDY